MFVEKILVALMVAIALPAEGVIDTCKTHDIILDAGYPAERYDAVTEDGYILEVNRIPRGKNQLGDSDRPVVLIMHGLGGCSSNFVTLGSEYSLAFNLADAGFDVWLGNARGVGMSRRHVSLDPDDRRQKQNFFDYSWEEIGLYDLPAMINKALEISGKEKLNYIGHSQGGTAFFVLNSMKPEYNEKFIAAHLLAASGYQNYFPSRIIGRIASHVNIFYNLARSIDLVEINGPRENNGIIDDIFNSILNITLTDKPASLAAKQVAHYGQNVKDKQFRRWSYSPIQNLFKYGSTSPPIYDLKKINVEIIMHYSIADILIGEKDVLDMAQDLPNCVARKVAKDNFSHIDFISSRYTKSLVTEYIIDHLRLRSD